MSNPQTPVYGMCKNVLDEIYDFELNIINDVFEYIGSLNEPT